MMLNECFNKNKKLCKSLKYFKEPIIKWSVEREEFSLIFSLMKS